MPFMQFGRPPTNRPPWKPIYGWKYRFGRREIPAIANDLRRLYVNRGKRMTTRRLSRMAKRVEGFRAAITLEIGDYRPLCGLVFSKPSGSMLVVFPRHGDAPRHNLRVYTMGELTIGHCLDVAYGLIDAFDETLLDLKPFDKEKRFRRKV